MLSYLYAWETQPGIYGQLLHPSTEEFNYTRRDRVKEVLVNTPTFTWAYTRTLKERGKKRSVTRSTSVVFPMQWDVVYLNNNNKKKRITNKYSQNNNNKSGKFEYETLSKL